MSATRALTCWSLAAKTCAWMVSHGHMLFSGGAFQVPLNHMLCIHTFCMHAWCIWTGSTTVKASYAVSCRHPG